MRNIKLQGQHDGTYGAVTLDGIHMDPSRSQTVVNHSQDGFSWGYGGSGPSQLALAILLNQTEEIFALKNYQNLKWDIIAKLAIDSPFEIEFDVEPYCS
jgi:hypothetical protein